MHMHIIMILIMIMMILTILIILITKAKPISYDVFMVKNLAAKPDQLKEYMIDNGPTAGTSKRFDDDGSGDDDGGL